ncbi:MAG TPA: protoglobin domain-containing protein [Anaerolineae bacterium]|nr:protoglobin domain-containing protein [Anaerolineae bacterium]
MDTQVELTHLAPDPVEEWQRMLRFVGWSDKDKIAASRTVEVLFRRGPELVAGVYDYLRSVPETAAILGWERGVDEAHLEERRRFFTVWLARTLGLDASDEFAMVLFRAGKLHAGHGPRHIHTPADYVTGSFGLVLASFSQFMAEAHLEGTVIAEAMSAWSKYFSAQLNQMMLGYHAARELEKGTIPIRCAVYGLLRPLLGAREIQVRVGGDARIGDVLRKFFNYYPQARAGVLDRVWRSRERNDALWMDVAPSYVPRRGWLVRLNGRDICYAGGCETPVRTGDEVAIFPPGR